MADSRIEKWRRWSENEIQPELMVTAKVGHTDSDDTTVLHVPDLDLVVAGDVIYNGVHVYLGPSVAVGGFGTWRDAIDKVEALKPRHCLGGPVSPTSRRIAGGSKTRCQARI